MTLQRISNVDGFGYDTVAPGQSKLLPTGSGDYRSQYTQGSNPCLLPGRTLGFLAPSNNADGTGAGSSTLAMGITVGEEILSFTGGATVNSVGNLLPANSLIMGVSFRVVIVIASSRTISIGDSTQAARFQAAATSGAAGTTGVGTLHWNPAVASDALGPRQVTATTVRVTASGTAASGAVRVIVPAITHAVPPF